MAEDKIQSPFCPKCKASRGSGSYCGVCGTAMVSGMRSCDCGYADIWPHENFCQECGKPAISMEQHIYRMSAEKVEVTQ